jgi:hypothetical protein
MYEAAIEMGHVIVTVGDLTYCKQCNKPLAECRTEKCSKSAEVEKD